MSTVANVAKPIGIKGCYRLSSESISELSHSILDIIFKRRGVLDPYPNSNFKGLSTAELPSEEVDPHIEKLQKLIRTSKRIDMTLPAFPGKSPNRNKTLSHLPDLAEKHAIDNLQLMCMEINEIYSPGAHIHICSDGYVFSDLVRIPDPDVASYTDELIRYCRFKDPSVFSMFDLKDAFPELKCLDSMREELMIRFGESLVSLKDRAKKEGETGAMYKGITRFLFEDYQGLSDFSELSKTKIQNLARSSAYRVIQRSNAWGDLLDHIYPDNIRLSVHPQFRVSKKIGIKLVPTTDLWRTPWHSVAIKKEGKVFLDKRSSVDEGFNYLVFKDGRPCHYIVF